MTNKIISEGIIWKDKLNNAIFGFYFFSFIAFFCLGVLFFNDDLKNIIPLIIIGGAITSICIFLFFKRSLIIIKKDGIIFDSLKLLGDGWIKPVIKRNFIKWKDISELNFENHYVRRGRGFSTLFSFLIVRTNKNEYLVKINDILGFVSTLILINKKNLLTKDALKFIDKLKNRG